MVVPGVVVPVAATVVAAIVDGPPAPVVLAGGATSPSSPPHDATDAAASRTTVTIAVRLPPSIIGRHGTARGRGRRINTAAQPSSTPMSSFQSVGLAAMKSVISSHALGVVEHHDLDAARPQQVLAAVERAVLADDDTGDLVQQDRAGAHVARRQRRDHRRPGVDRGRQTAGVLEAVGLAVLDGAALLHPPVVADGQHLAVDDERGADRDAALGPAGAGLGDGGVQVLGVGHGLTFTPGSEGSRSRGRRGQARRYGRR